MRDRGIPVQLINLFRYWYANQTNSVKWSNSISEPYGLECGVRQGGISSPTLFNLYVNDLIVELSSRRVGCWVGGVNANNFSYADDMVVLGPTVRAIAELLEVCESYAKAHGLIYNVKKSQYMIFKAGGKCPEHISPVLNGVKLTRVYQFRYLGHILTDDLRDDADIERERRSLAIRGNMLIRRFARCSDQVKITLFKAYCQSMYTGSLWFSYTKKSLNTLRIQYNNIFRMMLKLPRFCSASGMFAQAQTDGFHAIIRKRVSSMLRRVRGSENSILKIVAQDLNAPLLRHVVRVMTEIEDCRIGVRDHPHGVPRKYMIY
ncbi:uncharacterized protein LOC106137482 [Amyelois transitella]|uniref:uncharacterized protein LOC106137482 n=1 Tax=Amyelois transitella TaxID=680683 RepID=UPI00298F7204|nr:uncharacterized protein LOC106137482 [Amyelois transitella]